MIVRKSPNVGKWLITGQSVLWICFFTASYLPGGDSARTGPGFSSSSLLLGGLEQIRNPIEPGSAGGSAPSTTSAHVEIPPQSPQAFAALQPPSWWSIQHAAKGLIAAALVLLAVLVWTFMPKRTVRKQTGLIRRWLQRESSLRIQDHDRFENANDAILILARATGMILDANQTASETYGYSRSELLGMNLKNLTMADSAGEEHVRQLLHDESATNLEAVHRDQQGSQINMLVNSSAIEYAGVKAILCSNRDITVRKRTEEALRRSEEKYRSLISNIPDVTWTANSAGRIAFISPNIETVSGYGLDEIYQQGMALFLTSIHPEDIHMVREAFEALFRAGRPYDVECRIQRKDGEWIWIHDQAVATYEKDGIRYADGLLSDVTPRKRAEEALKRSEACLAAGEKLSHTGSWSWDLASGELFWSNEVYRIFDFDPAREKASIGDTFLSRIHPEDRPRIEAGLANSETTINPVEVDYRIVLPDGTIRYLHEAVYRMSDESGKVVKRFGAVSDVTEYKRAQEALILERDKLELVTQNVGAGLRIISRDHRTVWANNVSLRDYGETVGKRCFAADNGQSSVCSNCGVREIFEQGKTRVVHEQWGKDAQGKATCSETVATPIRDDSGNIVAALQMVTSITERKQAEEARAFLASIVESTEDAVIATSLDGNIVSWNRGASVLLGYKAEEILGKPLSTVIPTGNFEHSLQVRESIRRGAVVPPFEAPVVDRNGKHITGSLSVFSVKNAAGEVIAVSAIIRDMTERRLAEEARRESEEQFRQLAENIQEVFFVAVPDPPRVTYISPVYEERWGRSRQALYNRVDAWMDSIHPEDRALAKEKFAAALRGKQTDSEYRSLRPDGSIRYVRVRAFPVYDAQGRFYRVVGIAEDQTNAKRVEHEIMKAKDAAEAANRAKTDFLANMSHEIRTPMSGIIGMAEILQDTSLTAQQAEYLRLLSQSANSLMVVINDVLDVSKIEAGKLSLEGAVFNLRDCVDAAASALVAQTQKKELVFSASVTPAVPEFVVGDALRVRQILLNLLGNAIKFTEKGEIRLVVDLASQTDERAFVHFTVSDTGIGIPAEKQQLIFDAFSQVDTSTTRKYGGTGLGLSIVRRLAELMNGRAWVESETDKGSTFHCTAAFGMVNSRDRFVPPVESSGQEREAAGRELKKPTAVSDAAKQVLRILLAEDNAINQRVICRMLGKKGHFVVVAGNGREALNLLEKKSFDIVLMDAQMPEMDGLGATIATREREKATGRHIPILAVTAHSRTDELERCMAAGMDGCVTKPVHEAELLTAIHAVMTAATASANFTQRKESAPAFDERALLSRVNGDLDLLRSIVGLFLEDYPLRIADMHNAACAGDAGRLERQAHALKGAIANFTMNEAYEAAKALEALARAGNLKDAERELAALEVAAANLVPELVRVAGLDASQGPCLRPPSPDIQPGNLAN